MTPQLRADRIETRRQLAALARHHKWTTTEPDPGRWWVLLELWHPWHHVRINIRWADDQCTMRTDYEPAPHRIATWHTRNITAADIAWLIGNADQVATIADAGNPTPAIDLRETA